MIVNGIKFDQLPADHPFRAIYKKQLTLLQGILASDNVVFVTPDRLTTLDGEGKKQYPSGAFILQRGKYVHPKEGEFNIIVFDESFSDKNGKEVYRPRKYDFPGKLDVVDYRIRKELVWFLIFVSPHIEPIVELKDEQNLIRKTVYFELQNKKADSKKRMDQQKKELIVRAAILNDKDGLNVNQIKSLAKAYNIAHVDQKSEEELRIELFDLVLGPDKYSGKLDPKKLDKFLDVIPKQEAEQVASTQKKKLSDGDPEVGALIKELLEKNIMTPKQSAPGWITYYDEDGKKVVSHQKEVSQEYFFTDYFKKNPQVEKTLREKLKALPATV